MKKITALILCAVMLTGSALMTACTFNGGASTGDVDGTDSYWTSDSSFDTSGITDSVTTDNSTYVDFVTDPVTTEPPSGGDALPEDPTADQRAAAEWCDAAYDAAKDNRSLSANSETKKISEKWSKVYSVICSNMDKYYQYFLAGGIGYSQFEALMKSYSQISTAEGLALGYIESAKLNREDVDHLSNAHTYVSAQKFMKAAVSVAKVSKSNTVAFESARALVAANAESFKTGVTDAVTEYMVRYELSKGKSFLNAMKGYGIDAHIDAELERLEEYRVFQDEKLETVYLSETLENIYTHCLIAFPEINFETKNTYGACGPDCLTPYEFKYLLQSLYDRGYIIIDANLVYDAEGDCPVYKMKLPEGKKPLIFTFDDVTYDFRKMGKGMVDKLIVDEDGYVCTYTKHKDGTEVVSYENELFPILDAFVREHPDFTYQGARGTLFFTGFDGICGYRTQSEPVNDAEARLNLDRQDQIAQAKVVIEAMRAEGWTFGSHGYNHSNMPKISATTFRREIDMWREEVGAIVGDTQLFCWPYGAHTSEDKTVNLRKNAQHQYLFESGFTFFFGCGSARYLSNELDGLGIFSDRKGVTGNVLAYIAAEYKTYVRDYPYLFDTEEIWDPLRRQYKDWILSKL